MFAFRPISSCDDGAQGFVIVPVLWILAALAALASVYALYLSNTAIAGRIVDDRLQAESLISAGLELAAYRLIPFDENSRPTAGAFQFRLGRSDVGVQYRSEGARIDLNAAPKELLAGLFSTLGAKPDDAKYYADRIIAWRTKVGGPGQNGGVAQNGGFNGAQKGDQNSGLSPDANGGQNANQGQGGDGGQGAGPNKEADAYKDAGMAYPPRQAPFENAAELRLVMGLPPAFVERALPFVTIFNGRPEIDAIEAAPEVIASLPKITPDALAAFLAQRHNQDPRAVLQLLGVARSSAAIEGRKATRIALRVTFENGRRVNADVVILLLDDGPEPYRILSWRDDFDGIM